MDDYTEYNSISSPHQRASFPSNVLPQYGVQLLDRAPTFVEPIFTPKSSSDTVPYPFLSLQASNLVASGAQLSESMITASVAGQYPVDFGMDGICPPRLSVDSYHAMEDTGNYPPWSSDGSMALSPCAGPSLDVGPSHTGLGDVGEFETLSNRPTTCRPETSTPSALFPDSRSAQFQSHFPTHDRSKRPRQLSTSRPGSSFLPPLSPVNSMVSSPSGESNTFQCAPNAILNPASDTANIISEDETDEDSASSEEPYARLIWRALMSAPGHKMVLKEIYEWFEKNTNKSKNSDSKGWQNSIRHNLSMNAAFEGVKEASTPGGPPRKAGNAWVLTERAIKHGVESTTRYRKPGINKKSAKSGHPAPQRQRSGAKGGRAARKSAKFRRAVQSSQREDCIESGTDFIGHQFNNDNFSLHTPCVTYGQMPSNAFSNFNLSADDYSLGNVVGCTKLPDHLPLFYNDSEAEEEAFFSQFSLPDGCEVDSNFNPLAQL